MLRCLAAGSSALRPVLEAPARPADCLGVTRGALYLKTAVLPGLLAILTHDAVRLPCGLVLAATSAELPLTSAARPDSPGRFVVGDGEVRWTGPVGPVVVSAVREWAPARVSQGEVAPDALATVRSRLSRADPGIDGQLLADLAAAPCDRAASVASATRLLGNGPGLTPSGDDVLAGFLVGATAFGFDAAALREATAVLAPARTTALSAALLWHAARGECIDELASLAAVLTSRGRCQPGEAGRAVARLVSVGHTSGTALAFGLVTAAERALAGTGLADTVLADAVLADTLLAGTGLADTVLAESGRAEAGRAEAGRAERGDAA